MDWIHLTMDSDQWLENGNEASSSRKYREILN